MERAGFWRRAAAALLDAIVCAVLGAIGIVCVTIGMGALDEPEQLTDYVAGIA
jgi:hypothetical protein